MVCHLVRGFVSSNFSPLNNFNALIIAYSLAEFSFSTRQLKENEALFMKGVDFGTIHLSMSSYKIEDDIFIEWHRLNIERFDYF